MMKKKSLVFLLFILALVACSSDNNNSDDPNVPNNPNPDNPYSRNSTSCEEYPTLETLKATEITFEARLNGVINAPTCEGRSVISQGFVYATKIQPTKVDNLVEVKGQNISALITNLEINTKYYYRTYFTNSTGTYYGNEISFFVILNRN